MKLLVASALFAAVYAADLECVSNSEWVDSLGDDCEWYDRNPGSCGTYGDGAFHACCACGGGSVTIGDYTWDIMPSTMEDEDYELQLCYGSDAPAEDQYLLSVDFASNIESTLVDMIDYWGWAAIWGGYVEGAGYGRGVCSTSTSDSDGRLCDTCTHICATVAFTHESCASDETFVDDEGESCEWYEWENADSCGDFGAGAYSACCECGGGSVTVGSYTWDLSPMNLEGGTF